MNINNVGFYSPERDEFIRTLKHSVLNGTTAGISDEYSQLVNEWKESFKVGVAASIHSFDNSFRDFEVFNRVSELTKYKFAYLDEFTEGRESSIAAFGGVIFYLDSKLAAYRVAGSKELLNELRSKGLRHGTCFDSSKIGVFVANMAFKHPGHFFCRIGEENYLSIFSDYACFAYYECEEFREFEGVTLIILPKKRYNYTSKTHINYLLKINDLHNITHYPFTDSLTNTLYQAYYLSKDMVLLIDEQCTVVFTSQLFEKEFGKKVLKGPYPHIGLFMSELLFIEQYIKCKREHTTREVRLTDAKGIGHNYIVDFYLLTSGGMKCQFVPSDAKNLNASKHYGQKTIYTFDSIVGKNAKFLEIKNVAVQAAEYGSNVLIQGESGTGKELMAQSIHSANANWTGPFVPINCASISPELLSSELFGYEDGAFTGARKGGQAGKFEQADGGSIFLDEISEMPLHMQSSLLRILEDGVVSRVGGNRYIPLNVRVIAATNKDLWACVQAGTFRSDLYFRLSIVKICIPPLRARQDDIELLMYHLLERLSKKRTVSIRRFSPEVIALFKQYTWPGNVREVRNVIERCASTCKNDVLTLDRVPEDILMTLHAGTSLSDFSASAAVQKETNDPTLNWKNIDRSRIISLMEQYNGNKTKVAKALRMSRGTLYKKLEEYSLDG